MKIREPYRLKNGKIVQNDLAYKTTVFENEKQMTDCTDREGKNITADQYDGIADTVYGRLEKQKAVFHGTGLRAWENCSRWEKRNSVVCFWIPTVNLRENSKRIKILLIYYQKSLTII